MYKIQNVHLAEFKTDKMNIDALIARFDRLDRQVNNLEAMVVRNYRFSGRDYQIFSEDKLIRVVLFNVITMIFIFVIAVIACIFIPDMITFTLILGLCGCMWTGILVNQLGLLILAGIRDG